jgi:hypothetical protein
MSEIQMFGVQMQFTSGSTIWVARLNPDDPIYEYDNETEAQDKATELQSQDLTGRQYRATKIP